MGSIAAAPCRNPARRHGRHREHHALPQDQPHHYIVVASTDPIERRLSPILEAAEQAIVEYESRISQFTSPTDALSLMDALAGP